MTNEEAAIIWQQGNQKQRNKALTFILKRNRPFIYKELLKAFKGSSNMDDVINRHIDDLYQIACIEIMKALDTYDINTGYRLITWIKPRLKAAKDIFYRKSVHTIHKKAPDVFSLNKRLPDHKNPYGYWEYIDMLEGEPVEYFDDSDFKYISKLQEDLTEKEKFIINEYYGDLERTQEDIGDIINKHRQAVGLVITNTERHLRRKARSLKSTDQPFFKELHGVYSGKYYLVKEK